jgi:hypothetical protein
MDRKEIAKLNAGTPTYLDNIGNYRQLDGNTLTPFINSPFQGYMNASDPEYPPRGSLKIKSIVNTVAPGNNTVATAVITYAIDEPVMVSPFCYGDDEGKASGLTGINQINLTMNLDATASRAFRWANLGVATFTNKAVTNVSFAAGDCYVEARFLTPHATDLIPSTCISPFSNIVAYQTSALAPLPNGAVGSYTSSNIQLNSIPDAVMIFVRPQFGGLKGQDADAYATIENISINFNNNNGVLSSASKYMLWKMSREAGSNQHWQEFNGEASGQPNANPATFVGSYAVPTTGSVLYLKFGEHIQISENYYAPSSQGNFNFAVTVNCINKTGLNWSGIANDIAAGTASALPELTVVTINSGVFVSQNGVSSSYTGVLTKQAVLDAAQQEAVARGEIRRLLGGGFFSSLKAIASKALPHVVHLAKKALPHVASYAKEHLAQSGHPLAGLAHKGIEMAGYGMSGGRVGRHLKK